MSTDAPWVSVVILVALNVLLGMVVFWLLSAKSSPGDPAVTPTETATQVQGGQTSTDAASNLATSTGADTVLAGRDAEVNG